MITTYFKRKTLASVQSLAPIRAFLRPTPLTRGFTTQASPSEWFKAAAIQREYLFPRSRLARDAIEKFQIKEEYLNAEESRELVDSVVLLSDKKPPKGFEKFFKRKEQRKAE